LSLSSPAAPSRGSAGRLPLLEQNRLERSKMLFRPARTPRAKQRGMSGQRRPPEYWEGYDKQKKIDHNRYRDYVDYVGDNSFHPLVLKFFVIFQAFESGLGSYSRGGRGFGGGPAAMAIGGVLVELCPAPPAVSQSYQL
jgi:hypothetical protein